MQPMTTSHKKLYMLYFKRGHKTWKERYLAYLANFESTRFVQKSVSASVDRC